jgi:hypothetical protein
VVVGGSRRWSGCAAVGGFGCPLQLWLEAAAVGWAAELCAVDGLDDGGADELALLLGGLDGVVLGGVEAVVLVDVLGALVLCVVETGVVGVGKEVVVGVGTVAEVCVWDVTLFERVSGDVLALVPTEAVGGGLGLWLPLRSTRIRAVAKAAITATESSPATSPAPPAPLREPCGGSPTPMRSAVRSPVRSSIGSIRAVGRSAEVLNSSVGSGDGPGVVSGSLSGCGKTAMPS